MGLVEKLRFGNKFQCYAIVAVAFASRRRTVIKNMPLVTATASTVIFGAGPNHFEVSFGVNVTVDGVKKTRPTGTTIKFTV